MAMCRYIVALSRVITKRNDGMGRTKTDANARSSGIGDRRCIAHRTTHTFGTADHALEAFDDLHEVVPVDPVRLLAVDRNERREAVEQHAFVDAGDAREVAQEVEHAH